MDQQLDLELRKLDQQNANLNRIHEINNMQITYLKEQIKRKKMEIALRRQNSKNRTCFLLVITLMMMCGGVAMIRWMLRTGRIVLAFNILE